MSADVPTAGLGQRAARGFVATGSGQAVRLGLQVASLVVLSRLLGPEDFGTVILVTSVLGIANILRELGLSTAAIQAAELSNAQRSNLFWLSSLAGLGASVLVVAAAPILPHVFGTSDSTAIALALAPTFLLSGVAAQHRAQLVRTMRFTALAVTEVVAAAAALAVAVAMALAGAGPWALVAQLITSAVVSLVLVLAIGGWRPRRYDRGAPMRDLVTFGGSVLGSQVLTYITINVDSFLVGRQLGTVPLGEYSRAVQVVRTPANGLRTPLATVLLPTLSRLQGDPAAFARFGARAQLVISYPVLALLGLFVATSEPAIQLLLGPQWVGIAPLAVLIAIGEAVSTVMFVVSIMFSALGMSRLLIRFTLLTSILRVGTVLIAVGHGLVAVAAAYAVLPFFVFPLALWWLRRSAGLPVGVLAWQAVRVFLVTGGAAVVAHLAAEGLTSGLGLSALVCATLAMVLTLAGAALVPSVRADYAVIWGFGRRLLARPKTHG